MTDWIIRRIGRAIKGVGRAISRYVEGCGAIAAGKSVGSSVPTCLKCLGGKMWSILALGSYSVAICTAVAIVATVLLGVHMMGA